MKVLFSLNPETTQGGGGVSFARTLADALGAAGVPVSFDLEEPADVLLVFAHVGSERLMRRAKRAGMRIVQRLDERIDPDESRVRLRKHGHLLALNRFVDLTIFQSQFVRVNMGPWCVAPASRVILNGVDPRVFHPGGPRMSLEGDPAVLHVSWSIGASKRLDRLGDLLAVAPPGLRLHLVGRHADTHAAWLTDPRVIAHGAKPRDDVATLMRSATFLFFPSQLEPCPNTPIEAMASGLPVLYDASGGTPEVLGDTGMAMSDSLAADIDRMVKSRDTLAARAIARAPAFHAERVVADYLAAFEAVLAVPPAPTPPRFDRLLEVVGLRTRR